MIDRNLIDISGNAVDLSKSDIFMRHYETPSNYCQTIIDEINKDKIYEGIFSAAHQNSLVLVDVGANVGLFTYYLYPLCSKIVCIEPTPKTLNVLKDVKRALQLNKIEILEGALSDSCGDTTFFINDGNTTMNSLVFNRNMGYDVSTIVKTYDLEYVFNTYQLSKIDFLKIDTEGSEEIILGNSQFEHYSGKIESIYVEVHQGLGSNLQRVENRLKEIGFSNIHLTPYSANQGVYAKKS